ncbi:hypothetical protein SASPL_120669 [Salvia splendens]|uniref:Phytocyanin domain-containing protein n=1 Tax=Salvia splendens TaxID=180675 RepID=A0A8X8XQY3_SALSN|nr:hypothetical protein SASPL_120669 [Salvia splendens]
MAPMSVSFPLSVVIMSMVVVCYMHRVECAELNVGGDDGWVTPSSKNQLLYNDWASKNRLGDGGDEGGIREMPVVLSFFANNGDTAFILERSYLFYFISGISTHCQRGLKMKVKYDFSDHVIRAIGVGQVLFF